MNSGIAALDMSRDMRLADHVNFLARTHVETLVSKEGYKSSTSWMFRPQLEYEQQEEVLIALTQNRQGVSSWALTHEFLVIMQRKPMIIGEYFPI